MLRVYSNVYSRVRGATTTHHTHTQKEKVVYVYAPCARKLPAAAGRRRIVIARSNGGTFII